MTHSHIKTIADVKPFQKPQDSVFSKLINRRLSRVFTFWLMKLRPDISPSTVSTLSFFISAIGIGLFLHPNYLWRLLGIVLLQVGFSLDCSDGEISRIQNSMSAFGAWLDSVFDRFKEVLMLAALTAQWYWYTQPSPFNGRGEAWVIVLGAAAIIMWQVIGYLREAKKSSWPSSRTAEMFISKNMYIGTVDVTIYLVCAGVLFQQEVIALWIFFLAAFPLIAKQLLSAFRMK
jgi:phosphatidylglycerophosphate synthase